MRSPLIDGLVLAASEGSSSVPGVAVTVLLAVSAIGLVGSAVALRRSPVARRREVWPIIGGFAFTVAVALLGLLLITLN